MKNDKLAFLALSMGSFLNPEKTFSGNEDSSRSFHRNRQETVFEVTFDDGSKLIESEYSKNNIRKKHKNRNRKIVSICQAK